MIGAGDLTLDSLSVKHNLEVDLFELEHGEIRLSDSNAAVFQYSAPLWPPKPGAIDMDGFTYQRLRFGDEVVSSGEKVENQPSEWINLLKGGHFHPQPYRQLAKVLADTNPQATGMHWSKWKTTAFRDGSFGRAKSCRRQ